MDVKELLRDTENEIIVFGTAELSKVALSLLWFLGKTPIAFTNNNKAEHGSFIHGIPVLPPEETLANKVSPIVLICSYSKENTQAIAAQVNDLAEKPIFLTAYEIEFAYIKEKSGIERSKMKVQIGSNAILPCNSLRTYMYFVERDYQRALEDLYYVSANIEFIRTLEIRTPSNMIDSAFVEFTKKIWLIDNILYITIKTDPYTSIPIATWDALKRYILKITFYNYPAATQTVQEENFKNLPGRIPFLYIEKNIYQPQTVGANLQLLTTKYLLKIIGRGLGIDTQSDSFCDDREICLVKVSGGLGNQILTYLWACLISENTSKKIIIDDTLNDVLFHTSTDMQEKMTQFIYDHVSKEEIQAAVQSQTSLSLMYYKRLELYEIFCGKFQLFSELFPRDARDKLLQKLKRFTAFDPLFVYLSELGCEMAYYGEQNIYDQMQINAKNYFVLEPNLAEISKDTPPVWMTAPMKNSYYSQFLLVNIRYWNTNNRKWAQTIFNFPPIEDKYNQDLATRILNSDSVVIHIRRGNFSHLEAPAAEKALQYFQTAIRAVSCLKEFPHKEYFVFSDETEWCQAHELELGLNLISNNVTYVDKNTGKNAFRDLQLLSMGKILVMSQGTFSLCAFILSHTAEKYTLFSDYMELKSSGVSAEEIQSELIKDTRW